MNTAPTLEQIAEALGIDLVDDGVQLVNGRALAGIATRAPFESGLVPWSPLRPALVVDLPDVVAARAFQYLLGYVASGQRITTVLPDQVGALLVSATDVTSLTEVGPITAALIPGQDAFANGSDPRGLQQIVARLRDVGGCPWDRKQTMKSLRDTYINEVYEVVDAIDAGDNDNLAEELGDLFLIIAMQSQIAREHDVFTIEDVFARVTSKIIGRHPHVFGEAVVNSQADLARVWNEAKARERAARSIGTSTRDVDGEPRSMPALARASRVLERYPLQDRVNSPLLRAVADLVDAGLDPERTLRDALRDHVETSRVSSETTSPNP